ncbi:protein ENHANCED DOWNY MILDEW 2 isoform X1 [Lolium perenne]|uniref:protein ENHANCED DOWNY MILDEW 2 isoform X1 n=1 Tax=Lolium perenne TaxID=4522 RepID=UPI0021F5AB59|nr:protein ENHANCED DOWNY MILDEW 2-like isoform X1 [Lolium perenne]
MAVIKMPVSRRRKAKGEQGSNPNRAGGETPVKKVKRGACVLCDDGGDLICCDGGCQRSFHPTEEHGEDSMCATLGMPEEQWQKHVAQGDAALYTCKNCQYKQHQCFACGLLGSSDLASGPEVFQCKHQKCGHFYHPNCVAKLLNPDSKTRAVLHVQHIAGGLEFECPVHQCKSCKEAENKDYKEMQFAVCRRCPTAYHRKCLPSDISFEESEETGNPRRAWEKILHKQILIYCMKHEIQPDLGTPMRDHIFFPDGRNPVASKRARGTPQEHDILEKDEQLDRPSSSKPSQSPQPAEIGHHRVKPIDSFAPKHLFLRPQPGSCGWLDE